LHHVFAALPDKFGVLKITVGKQVNLVDGFHA
jgi:hypothetical protein